MCWWMAKDLYGGYGTCSVRDTGEQIDAPALIALKMRYRFESYFLVDFNSSMLVALPA